MNTLTLENYNLHWTLMGGQSFAWEYDETEKTYFGFTQDKIIKIIVEANDQMPQQNEFIKIKWQTYPKKDDYEFLKKYFRLDEDYQNILLKINKDKYMNSAISEYPNLRLLSQDFEQTALSFMLSANNNIRAIRNSIRKLNQSLGKKIIVDNNEFYLFPRTEVIAEAPLEKLLESRIGFRAKFMKNAAKEVIENDLTLNLHNLEYKTAKDKLMSIKGVGEKIADCILVFSLKHDHITPLDVWGKRFLTEYYNLDSKMKYDDMRNWTIEYFEGKAAWAGQFLYEYIRNRPKIFEIKK